MDKTFSGLLSFSIVGGYFILFVALFWFLSVTGNSSIDIVALDGSKFKILLNSYQYNIASSGVVFVLTFGGAGFIFLYVFIISPVIEEQQRKFETKTSAPPKQRFQAAPNINAELLREGMPGSKYNEEHEMLFADGTQINVDKLKRFVRNFPETALKFATRKEMSSADIDDFTKQIFIEWEIKGLNKQIVQNEIRNIANIGYFGSKLNMEQSLLILTEAIAKDKDKFG